MAEANLGAKLEYFFGNATGSAYNIQQSGEMATTLNRIGILDNPAGRSLFETHLRQTFADPESVVAVQDNGRIVREGLLFGPGGIVKTQTIWEGNQLITGNIFDVVSRY